MSFHFSPFDFIEYQKDDDEGKYEPRLGKVFELANRINKTAKQYGANIGQDFRDFPQTRLEFFVLIVIHMGSYFLDSMRDNLFSIASILFISGVRLFAIPIVDLHLVQRRTKNSFFASGNGS